MRRESAPKLSRGQEVQPPTVHRPPWSARSGGTLSLFGGEPVHVDHINSFDGGSGGHLLGQRWMQVREKATGDLLVFIFVKIPLQLSLFL